MTSCADYKNLIDRYLDLDDGERKAALDAHLATCASCEEYKADADKTMRLLRELKRHLTVATPVDQALEQLNVRLAASRRQLVWSLALIAVLVATPFAMLLRGGVPALGLGLVALAVVAAAGLVLAARRDQAALVRITQRPGGFYDTWRRDLEKRIRMTTGGAVLVSVWSVGFLFYSVLGPFGIVERTVVLATAVLLGWGGLNTFFVELRQLKSELALVKDASRA
jgi:hypothetical protein